MTTKQALEQLKVFLGYYDPNKNSSFYPMLDKIEVDLEILEILLNYLKYDEGFYINQAQWQEDRYKLEMRNGWEQKEDFKKLKELLKKR